jgi:hypothetical protein
LLHLRARWYNAETGTFLSRDTWEGSTNKYGYVNGNPVNLIDPFGWYGCNSTTGRCDDGRYLCVIQGNWSGSYVDGKPCIVNPGNVQTGNAPAPYTITQMEFCSPTYPGDMSWQYRPGCPQPPLIESTPQFPPSSSGIDRTRYLFAFEVIDIPCGVKLKPGAYKNDTLSNVFGVIGAGVDAYELTTIFKPNYSQVPAFFDVTFGLAGSVVAGETYLVESPHPELPNGVLLGQDFWVAAIDLGVAKVANATLPKLGAFAGATVGNVDGPVPISEGAGYLAGTLLARDIDVGLTEFGLYNDISRIPFNVKHQLIPPVPTWYGAGMMWEEIPFFVLLRYECPPTYCE